MATPTAETGCYSCATQAVGDPPPRDDVLHTDHWRVAHAFNSTLPGWLVLLPTVHVTSFTALAPEAADELGGLVRRLSAALEAVTGCLKTYLMQFSEAEGFAHLHLHLVPRMPDQPADRRGRAVFGYLCEDPSAWLSEDARDAVALAVRAACPDEHDRRPEDDPTTGGRRGRLARQPGREYAVPRLT